MAKDGGKKPGLRNEIRQLGAKLDALIEQLVVQEHVGESRLPDELIISPADLADANQLQLERWIKVLHVRVPPYMLREAIQRHLVRFGEVVERDPAKTGNPPPPPWKPKRKMEVYVTVSGKKRRQKGILAFTKSGKFVVKFQDGTKERFKTKEELFKVVSPVNAQAKKKKRKKKRNR